MTGLSLDLGFECFSFDMDLGLEGIKIGLGGCGLGSNIAF